ncbi:MAG: prepilin-type N-terminal cleavage/methylation domain-containing protein [Planctomycetota bacterium]|jgi:prepilin-type N-terminal cleavage/methylation domain-containing protein
MHYTKKHNNQKGFTLIEVMVSVTIFLLIVTTGLGAVLTGVDGYRKTVAQSESIDTVSFIMETMSRRIRTGHSYTCDLNFPDTNCSDTDGSYSPPNPNLCDEQNNEANGSDDLFFIDQDGDSVAYSMEEDSQGRYYVQRKVNNDDPEILTSPEDITFEADGLRFWVAGAGSNNGCQPIVVIRLRGVTTDVRQQASFSVQTTITQRRLDITSS